MYHTNTVARSADRRRRHLAVYHRAMRAASTPDERAAVAERYRPLLVAAVHGNANPMAVSYLAGADRTLAQGSVSAGSGFAVTVAA